MKSAPHVITLTAATVFRDGQGQHVVQVSNSYINKDVIIIKLIKFIAISAHSLTLYIASKMRFNVKNMMAVHSWDIFFIILMNKIFNDFFLCSSPFLVSFSI